MIRRRPEKIPDLLNTIRECVKRGWYLDTIHSELRKYERNITILEILQVFNSGFHEKRKDEWKTEYNAWNYAIRGKTIDERELRVVISFDANMMLIITAIDLF